MLLSRRLLRASLLAPLALLLPIAPARADTVDVQVVEPASPKPAPIDMRLQVGFHMLYAGGDLHDHAIAETPAYRAADLRFRGQGAFTGGAFSLTGVYARGLRFGWSTGFFGVSRVGVQHGPVSRDLDFSMGSTWGLHLDAHVGYAFDLGRFVPYLDLRGGMHFIKTSVGVHSQTLGPVQDLGLRVFSPILAPRLGLQIRLTDAVSLDVSGSASPIGNEMVTVLGGVLFTPRLE